MKKAMFIGHNECYGADENKLKYTIIECIEKGTVYFLNGGQGRFDFICARIIFEMKKDFPQIKNILVIPYLNFKVLNKKIFDDIIYPEGFEKYHYNAAIIQKNRYMVNQSDIAICYVNHKWGGAFKTYSYAKKQGLEIKNIADFE